MTAREQAAAAQREAEGRKRMSCNGCRVLRKGCSDTCILRPCLQWIDSPEAQGHATVFVAKFFGRAGLMAFINAVPENQRPALFQSLLYEACGRTVNPVYGAVGLLASSNWAVCQAAVETVLKGGTLRPPHASSSATCSSRPAANLSSSIGKFAMKPDLEIPLLQQQQPRLSFTAMPSKVKEEPQDTSSNHVCHGAAAIVSEQTRSVRRRCEDTKNPNAGQVCYEDNVAAGSAAANLDLTLNCEASSSSRLKRRVSSPSLVSVNSEGSVTSLESGSFGRTHSSERRIMLDLFP